VIECETSDEPFELNDGSGLCVIEPARAHVQTNYTRSWTEGGKRYTESWLPPGSVLYVLGNFVSENPAMRGLDENKEVGELLAEWKTNPHRLRDRFDADGDGEISLKEWQAARAEAIDIVRAKHAEARAHPAVNYLRDTGDDRPFVICDKSEDKVVNDARRSALKRMVWFGALLGGSGLLAVREARGGRRRRRSRAP
jgi:hypothetical protein